MDTGFKIYAEVLRKKLNKGREIREKEVLNNTQMEFRKGKGTAEAIYILKEVINNGIKKERGKVTKLYSKVKKTRRK